MTESLKRFTFMFGAGCEIPLVPSEYAVVAQGVPPGQQQTQYLQSTFATRTGAGNLVKACIPISATLNPPYGSVYGVLTGATVGHPRPMLRSPMTGTAQAATALLMAGDLGISPKARSITHQNITLHHLADSGMAGWTGQQHAQVTGIKWEGPSAFGPVSLGLILRTLIAYYADNYNVYTFVGRDKEKGTMSAMVVWRGAPAHLLDSVTNGLWVGNRLPIKPLVRMMIASPGPISRLCVAAAAVDEYCNEQHGERNSRCRAAIHSLYDDGHIDVASFRRHNSSALLSIGLTNFLPSGE